LEVSLPSLSLPSLLVLHCPGLKLTSGYIS
jgi:hypothetical protein